MLVDINNTSSVSEEEVILLNLVTFCKAFWVSDMVGDECSFDRAEKLFYIETTKEY